MAEANKTAAPATPAKTATPLEKARAARKAKVQSGERAAAEQAYKNAKSDQEKTAARGHLKAVRFKEIVVVRTRRAMKALEGVEALFNRSAYTWTDEQANKVLNVIATKVKRIQDKMIGAKKDPEEFSL